MAEKEASDEMVALRSRVLALEMILSELLRRHPARNDLLAEVKRTLDQESLKIGEAMIFGPLSPDGQRLAHDILNVRKPLSDLSSI